MFSPLQVFIIVNWSEDWLWESVTTAGGAIKAAVIKKNEASVEERIIFFILNELGLEIKKIGLKVQEQGTLVSSSFKDDLVTRYSFLIEEVWCIVKWIIIRNIKSFVCCISYSSINKDWSNVNSKEAGSQAKPAS